MSVPAPAVLTALLALGLHTGFTQAQDPPLGKTAAFLLQDSGTSITVPAGTALRSGPDPKSARLATIETQTELQVLERWGDWVRTAYRDWTGWLAPLGEQESEIPLTDSSTSLMTLDTRLVDQAQKLSRARQLLDGINPDFTSAGAWPLHTDVRDVELLALLDLVARQVPVTYAERFGLTPSPTALPAPVVLFAREESYRVFAHENPDIGELGGGGHADSTMAAFFVGEGASPTSVASVLVHELTHLLNRAHFAVAPSTWLEEGMANDLGFTRIDPKGRLEIGSLGGTSWMMAQRTSSGRTEISGTQSGGIAAWTQLTRDWGTQRSKLMPLDRLLDLPWAEFVDESHRSSNYSLSVFFLRYLLDEVEESTRVAFRDFLTAATQGGGTEGTALARALDTTPEALKHDFERWLTVQVVTRR